MLKEKIDKMLTSWRKLTGRSKERRKTPQQNCDEQVVCVSVCVQTSVHAHMCVLAGHGGESLVFQAEGPETEKSSTGLKTHEESSLPGVCWHGGQKMWDPRHSP